MPRARSILRRWSIRHCIVLLLPALLACSRKVEHTELHAAVASNFQRTFRQLADQFQAQTGARVVASFGSTGKLYAQVQNGAPFDVLLSADDARPLRLEREGLAVPGTRFTYALGRLAVYGSKLGPPKGVEERLRAGAYQRVAIANPSTAPYGHAAQQVLERLGVWSTVSKTAVRGENIAQTLQFVESGAVDVGFVALADVLDKGAGQSARRAATANESGQSARRAATANETGQYWTVPGSLHDPIRQDAILLVRGEKNALARAYLEHLKSASARALIERSGYGLAPQSVR